MDSSEIQKQPISDYRRIYTSESISYWLKEIAYQLAVMNENLEKTVFVANGSGDPREL